jgi:hypothetical protein
MRAAFFWRVLARSRPPQALACVWMSDDRDSADERDSESAPKTKLIQPIGTDPRTGRPYKPVEVPLRKRSLWHKVFKRAAKRTEES